jgi:phage repressor protein C with HTH and peptisase S24 domain
MGSALYAIIEAEKESYYRKGLSSIGGARMKSMNFGVTLKQLRKAQGIRQKDLAGILGVDESTISCYERGIRYPSRNVLKTLASFFHVSTDSLLNISPFDQGMEGFLKGYNVPLLGRASAGPGAFAEENIEEILVSDCEADFALRVHGDSMSPVLPDKSIVLVKKTLKERFKNSGIGVVIVHRDESFVKYVHFHKEGVWLISENKVYSPVFYPLEEWEESCQLVGIVVECRIRF